MSEGKSLYGRVVRVSGPRKYTLYTVHRRMSKFDVTARGQRAPDKSRGEGDERDNE